VDIASAIDEIVMELRRYGIRQIHGDNFCGEVVKQMFAARGVTFDVSHTLGASALPLWLSLRSLVSTRQIALLDIAESLAELKSLQLVATGSGSSRIEAAGSQHDDRAVALGLCAFQAITGQTQNTPFVECLRIPYGRPRLEVR
jgi:hypothetical protein